MNVLGKLPENADIFQNSFSCIPDGTYVDGESYNVLYLPDYPHEIKLSGRPNYAWVHPANSKPTHETLMPFRGNFVDWGINVTTENILETDPKFGTEFVSERAKTTITRNNETFYTLTSTSLSAAFSDAMTLLDQIKAGPIDFVSKDYDVALIGRHVQYRNEIYTIFKFIHGKCYVNAIPGDWDKDQIDCSLPELAEINDELIPITLDLLMDDFIFT